MINYCSLQKVLKKEIEIEYLLLLFVCDLDYGTFTAVILQAAIHRES
jgi:hypothetical protein